MLCEGKSVGSVSIQPTTGDSAGEVAGLLFQRQHHFGSVWVTNPQTETALGSEQRLPVVSLAVPSPWAG